MANIVQSASVVESTGPNTVLVMPSNVTAGNLLIIMTGHPGGNECTGGGTLATYTDTRGLTYTAITTSENPSGGQSNSCILSAPITSSGPQTITRNVSLGNYPVAMWGVEISGVLLPTVDATASGTADSGTSVSSGNVVSANPNLILLGAASDNVANAFDSVSPSGGTSAFVSPNGAFLVKLVGAGTYNPTFGKSAGGVRFSCTAALISFTIPKKAKGYLFGPGWTYGG
jgi:hypothetical protein